MIVEQQPQVVGFVDQKIAFEQQEMKKNLELKIASDLEAQQLAEDQARRLMDAYQQQQLN